MSCLRRVALLAALSAPSGAWADDCLDLVEAVGAIRAAVEEVRLDEARMMAEQTVDALTCQENPVNPLLLTNLFQLNGAIAYFQGDPGETEAAFRRAVAVAPLSNLDGRFGEEAALAYRDVQRNVLAEAVGSFTVLGQVEVWIDGRAVEPGNPVELPVGYHLLQWREDDELGLHGQILRMASAEARVLPLGSSVVVDGQPAHERSGAPLTQAARVGGGLLVVGSAVVLALGAVSSRDFDEADDPSELDSLRSRNHALVLTGAGLGVAGVGLVGISFLDGGPGLTLGLRF